MDLKKQFPWQHFIQIPPLGISMPYMDSVTVTAGFPWENNLHFYGKNSQGASEEQERSVFRQKAENKQ